MKKNFIIWFCLASRTAIVLLFIGLAILSFGLTVLITYFTCWCFDNEFSWKLALGIWLFAVSVQALIYGLPRRKSDGKS